jgi:hypothetical protein
MALAEEALAMLEEMAEAAAASGTDCGQGAAALQAIVAKNQALIEEGRTLDDDPGKKAWLAQSYRGRRSAALARMTPLLGQCKDHPELLKAFASMQ